MVKTIGLTLLAGLYLVGSALAAPVNVSINFAYNGTPDMETIGFKLYHKLPDGTEVVGIDINDPDARSWSGTMDVPEGRSVFTLASYSADDESGRSAEFPFEYIEPETTGGLPVPTVIIKFN